jgi:DNA repair exonuclease SbcCD ATPase subunit
MATFEDAAEELLTRLNGLDSEIEESEHKLTGLRERVTETTTGLESDWTSLHEAANTFFSLVHDQQERLEQQARKALQHLGAAQQAVDRDGGQVHHELAGGKGHVDALATRAAGLEPGVDSLAADAGEAPAHALAQRAHELQQELARLVDEARDFFHDDVVPALQQAAQDVHQGCEDLHRVLAEEQAAALDQAYQDWEAKLGQLEEYVATKGFQASRQHAHDVVDYALDECQKACQPPLDELQQLVGVLVMQLQQLAAEAGQATQTLVDQAGAHLLQELERAHTTGTGAVTALDAVKQRLATYSFLEV